MICTAQCIYIFPFTFYTCVNLSIHVFRKFQLIYGTPHLTHNHKAELLAFAIQLMPFSSLNKLKKYYDDNGFIWVKLKFHLVKPTA